MSCCRQQKSAQNNVRMGTSIRNWFQLFPNYFYGYFNILLSTPWFVPPSFPPASTAISAEVIQERTMLRVKERCIKFIHGGNLFRISLEITTDMAHFRAFFVLAFVHLLIIFNDRILIQSVPPMTYIGLLSWTAIYIARKTLHLINVHDDFNWKCSLIISALWNVGQSCTSPKYTKLQIWFNYEKSYLLQCVMDDTCTGYY
jgi:hypothetical protein